MVEQKYSIEAIQFRVKVLEEALGLAVLPDQLAESFEYTGPGYPRIESIGNGQRRISFNPTESVVVEELVAPQLSGGGRPEIYPGTVSYLTVRDFHYAPGYVGQARLDELDTSTGITDAEEILRILHRLRHVIVDNDVVVEKKPFVASYAFYFHPDDLNLPVANRRAAQGPLPGNPDSGVIPTFSTGAGNTPGYRAGTSTNPYKPWEDEDSEYFGWPVIGLPPGLPPEDPSTDISFLDGS